MNPQRWRDAAASAAGLTPSNGYRWPHTVNGRWRWGERIPDKKTRWPDRRVFTVAIAVHAAGLALLWVTGDRWLANIGVGALFLYIARVATQAVVVHVRLREAKASADEAERQLLERLRSSASVEGAGAGAPGGSAQAGEMDGGALPPGEQPPGV